MTSIKKSDHFYLIDGSGYIFRAYYALPPLTEVGVYPKCLALDTTELRSDGVSRNISFTIIFK